MVSWLLPDFTPDKDSLSSKCEFLHTTVVAGKSAALAQRKQEPLRDRIAVVKVAVREIEQIVCWRLSILGHAHTGYFQHKILNRTWIARQ